MKPGNRIVVMAGIAIVLAAPLAYSAGESGGRWNAGPADAFAPYSEDFTRGEPIPPEMLKTIEHAKALLAPARNPSRDADANPRAPRTSHQGAPEGSMPSVRSALFPRSPL
jgi:hypothetical protein